MVITASSMTSRAYAGNALFKDESYRTNSNNHDTVSADRKAMVRALDRLDTLDFDSTEDDDTKTIYNTVTSYLDVYNNAVSSALDSDSSHIQQTGKQMKRLMKEYSSELEAIGITIKSNGTVKIDKSDLQSATTRQVSKIFGDDSYKDSMKSLMKKLRNQVNREKTSQQVTETSTKSGTTSSSDSLLSDSVGNNLNLSV
jgi:phenylalanyl-tRNA synthetase beta subunit